MLGLLFETLFKTVNDCKDITENWRRRFLIFLNLLVYFTIKKNLVPGSAILELSRDRKK